ncbi:lanthionine synthetase LanC family protein [Streptomyces sp. NPDC052077]|uniref:class III lanthionine synthetase LanKC N-terminal domain-containing protein n=1 Tax=Streptomyces sp. NPDC052077 TaxID=3154757 RepID=UPI003437BDC4
MRLSWETVVFYLGNHRRWFEDVTRRQPDAVHLREYRAAVPATWGLRRRGYWLISEPPGADRVEQGWKLHVSATSRSSAEILRRALPVLRDAGVRFKFLMDPAAVAEVNGKSAPRGSSGKFITVYPPDPDGFHRIARALTEALDGCDGPYILSDRRYPGSRIVFYRYGAFTSHFRLRADGIKELLIQAPDGSWVPDVRTPYWGAPDWAGDPFDGPARTTAPPAPTVSPATASPAPASPGTPAAREEPAPAEEPPAPLLDGRYSVTGTLALGNRGGVYRAVDTRTGADVVLREARPAVEVGLHRTEAVALLHHEHRLLTELADTGLFVRPAGLFTAWEHSFLVEEFIDGVHLGRLSIGENPLYDLDLTPERLTAYYERLRALWLQVADAIAVCHERGIVLGDLSLTNILVTPEDRVRIIDLESACHEGVDRGAGLGTPGMAPRRAATGTVDRRADYYALGAVLLSGVLACQLSDVVEHEVPLGLLDELAADLDLPAEFTALVRDLYDEDAPLPDPDVLRGRIAGLPFATAWRQPPPLVRRPAPGPEDAAELRRRIREVLRGVRDYALGAADTTRDDRLLPADLLVFETNPLSLAHGAYGSLYALHTVHGEVPGELLAWALRHPTGHTAMPPGLYYGSAGVAWALSAMGHPAQAARVLRDTAGHPLLADEGDTGVLTGTAGHGMACLRLWQDTGDPEFLDRARALADGLARTARREEDRAHWPDAEDRRPVGYGHGPSGVAMFLLALHAVTGDPDTLALGRAALEHDLSRAEYAPSGLLSFQAYADDRDARTILRHYWDEGTAGILTTLLRYWWRTGDERLRKQVDRLLPDVRRKYTVFPQLFHGISGLGDALLDAYEFLGDPELLGDAERAARAVLRWAVRRPEGIVFPGEQTLRESADLATGSAGIALFLSRFEHTAPGARTNRNFLLDDLLADPRRPPGERRADR